MKLTIKDLIYTMWASTLLLVLSFLVDWQILHAFLGTEYVVLISFVYYQKNAQRNSVLTAPLYTSTTLLLAGTFTYYLYQLNTIGISITLAITALAATLYSYKKTPEPLRCSLKMRWQVPQLSFISGLLGIVFIASSIALYTFIVQNQTTINSPSPWLHLPKAFFFIYALATSTLIGFIATTKSKRLSLLLLILHTFSSISIALLLYPLGFGYDPFIHQATEQAIFNNGVIQPKPPYYIGQYALIVLLNKIIPLSVGLWDKILVPLASSIFIPLFMYEGLKEKTHDKAALLASLLLLALPLSMLITTTPQALANVYILLLVLTAQFKQPPKYLMLLFTIAAVAIHPLAGLPALIFFVIWYILTHWGKNKKAVLALFSLLGSISLPLAFFLNSKMSPFSLTISFKGWNNLIAVPQPLRLFNPFLDLVYQYAQVIPLLLLLGALIGSLITKELRSWRPYIITATILAINYALIKGFFTFTTVIDYEAGLFAKRIITIIGLVLIPVAYQAFKLIIKRIMGQPNLPIKLIALLIFTFTLVSGLYLRYPRKDNYVAAAALTVSQTDFDVVHIIEARHPEKDYIVYAPQLTSAAAVYTYGFNRYINNKFFYPIPTSSAQYQTFLALIDKNASPEELQALIKHVHADIYLVIPDYWRNAKRRIDYYSSIADEEIRLDTHTIFYFKQ